MSAKEPRRELAAAQIDMARTVLTQLFPQGVNGIGTHPEELAEAEIAAQVAGNLFRRAAEVHQGLMVSWKQMCDAAFLSAAADQLKESQDMLEPLLRQLGVELARQDSWRKGAALPGFRVVNGAGREPTLGGCASSQSAAPEKRRPHYMKAEEFDKKFDDGEEDITGLLDLSKTRRPAPAIEPEDLTALDGETEGDEQPEICSGCERQYSTCGYQPGAGDCEGFTR